jgi:hypothetical protein
VTKEQFKSWLAANYSRGQRLAFVADFSAVAEAAGGKPVSLDAVENWLYRNPPAQVGALSFGQALALTLERKAQPAKAAAIYTVHFALDERENKILLKTAKRAKVAPEQFLAICLRIGFEDQTGLDAE